MEPPEEQPVGADPRTGAEWPHSDESRLRGAVEADDADWVFDQPPGSTVRCRRDGTAKPDGERWRVYDPVYGIIPRETRECWQAQEAEAAARRAGLPARTLPPVRTYTQPAS